MLAYTEVRDREVEAAGEWFFVRKNGNQLSTGIVYNIVKSNCRRYPCWRNEVHTCYDIHLQRVC